MISNSDTLRSYVIASSQNICLQCDDGKSAYDETILNKRLDECISFDPFDDQLSIILRHAMKNDWCLDPLSRWKRKVALLSALEEARTKCLQYMLPL